jgi:hypothetical protein
MSRRWVIDCLMLFALGFGLMGWSYRSTAQAGSSFPLRVTLLIPRGDGVDKPADGALPVSGRFLPLADPAAALVAEALREQGPDGDRRADAFLHSQQEVVLLLPALGQVFRDDMLASGRLPAAGREEVLAGHAVGHKEQLTVARRTLRVVGVLPVTGRPLSHAYLLPGPEAPPGLFDPGESVRRGFLLVRPQGEEPGPAAIPRDQWTRIETVPRVARGTYYAYLAGMALVLAAGSALLVAGYLFLARRVRNRWLGPPLAEVARRVRLLVGLHALYFGLTLGAALLTYEIPTVQDSLLAAAGGQIESGQGPLGKAGEAYASRNVARAAVTTLAVNFVLGSLLFITLPSVVVPGLGLPAALFRALLWGLLLAPTNQALAWAMLPHSGTLLLEGEGYILATFFGLLIPVYLFSPKEGPSPGRRFGRAVVLNLKGNLVVLLVLAIAAAYESIEVILQMKG